MEIKQHAVDDIEEEFTALTAKFIQQGALISDLKLIIVDNDSRSKRINVLSHLYCKKLVLVLFVPIFCSIFLRDAQNSLVKNIRGTRCLIPNNYLVWEFTRPLSNCDYCRNVDAALILPNLTKDEFRQYKYSSKPIVIKGAAKHWAASDVFSWKFFRDLYENIDGAYESVEECQFLPFKSNFNSLQEVFAMSEARAKNRHGQHPWYVGWKNCHLQVLDVMRKHYNLPHFLPDDAEVPYTNYVFLGYEEGAIMHLDYISRLMWQGQVIGSKTWSVAPTPECDNICKHFNFSVSAGDIVLLDTRIWYHGTFVNNGEFSLTVTSEYG